MIELELSKKKSQFAKGPEGLLSGRKKINGILHNFVAQSSKIPFFVQKIFYLNSYLKGKKIQFLPFF